jgi:hypothetical protein
LQDLQTCPVPGQSGPLLPESRYSTGLEIGPCQQPRDFEPPLTAFTSPLVKRSSRSTAATSTWAVTTPGRAGPSMIGSSRSGFPTGVGCRHPVPDREPISR